MTFALLLLAAAAADTLPPPDDAALYAQLLERVVAVYDSTTGGFVAPKSGEPMESAVALGLKLGKGDRADAWTRASLVTMTWTRSLFDTVGGGYLRSSRSATLESAHFDKPTDANLMRLENHLLAWRLMNDATERKWAGRVVDFTERILLDGRGGFVTAQVGDREPQPRANGIAIHAWLEWAVATGDVRYRDFALRSLDRVWAFCRDEKLGALVRKGTFGDLLSPPRLDDQCEMGRAHILAAQVAGRAIDRTQAKALGELVLQYFEDGEKRGFRTQAVVSKDGKVKKSDRDFDMNARAALFLCELTTLTGDTRYQDAARRSWRVFAEDFAEARLDAADWALALRAALEPEAPAAPEWQVAEKQTAPKRSFRFKTRR